MPVHYHQGGFPPEGLDWKRLIPLIGPANAAIARYEGVLHGVPNPNVLLSPLTSQEAVLSSRIEGTQATLGEVLEFEAEGDPNDESTPKKADIQEVLNYRMALNEATRLLPDLPLSQRLVKEVHAVLMQGVRGRNKSPGEYRKIPNWIGPEGCTIEQARFVPVGADRLPDAMSEWEKYVHAETPDKLVQLAVTHAEFEAIHPFLDGNGRLGRLIVPLYLYSQGLLSRPNFYLSEFLESHREEYYERLLAVSRDGDWTGWCEFFLGAIIAQAQANQAKASAILALFQARKDWIVDVTRSQYAVRALDWMFVRPIFKTSDFAASVEIPAPTASRILRVVRDEGMLQEIRPGAGRRAAVLAFGELLDIADGR
ncbi:MAG: Fic family protein [Proteobacteria bacterium]|nr:Fic family protein [Pseudomonadota bacterium]